MNTQIKCPECNHKFDVEHAISSELEKSIREELAAKNLKQKKELEAKEQNLQRKFKEIEKAKASQDQIINEKLAEEKKRLRSELEVEVKKANEESTADLLKKISDQADEMTKLKRDKISFEQQVQDLKKKEEEMDLEIKEKVLAESKRIQEETKKAEQQKHHLDLKQKDELVNTLKEQIIDLQRKAEQGSMQSQGEILELEVERLLVNLYPSDSVEEIKKGANGADCVLSVNNSFGKSAGKIAFETKRTKSFSSTWIEKLKSDMRIHRADIGVIVTEAMPDGMEGFGLVDGIWVCKFSEVEGLSRVLRHSILKVYEVQEANEGRGEKMQVLYSYLISEEFKQQMEAIVRGFVNMKSALETEKRSMKRIWKQREKELELIIDGATEMHGSIRAIAGNSVAPIQELELIQESDPIELGESE
ncbi:DUF2130 domain-containing protein [Sanyastnella coralliicola]|uniref:DUF2130 domain-containing protein n=1 Tax=Sanyastnella coralliicola TaxID=3069118 RepID=UPI0027BA28B4|nr:DUF2130 domain-containing protein [Longitalea sp. SCSIO 12813]